MKITKQVIEKTRRFAKKFYTKTDFIHTWDHTLFVTTHAKHIAKKEKMDVNVVEVGALLHDIGRVDSGDDHSKSSAKKAEIFLRSLKIDEDIIKHVVDTIKYHSTSDIHQSKTKEALAVYDGDKLDRTGPRGYSRVITYKCYKHPEMNIEQLYDATVAIGDRMINTMKTKTGKSLAKKYMKDLKEFRKVYEKTRNNLKKY